MASLIRPVANTKNHQEIKEAIAKETQRSFAEVDRIYEQELSQLASQAKITQYLSVLAGKRVRSKLREH